MKDSGTVWFYSTFFNAPKVLHLLDSVIPRKHTACVNLRLQMPRALELITAQRTGIDHALHYVFTRWMECDE
jgi:hypothetical protein